MGRFLADEDVDAAIVVALRARGHDVQRHQEDATAPRGEADAAVLARAVASGRILLTHNRRDLVRLHRAGVAHDGILTVPQHPDSEGATTRIHTLLKDVPGVQSRLFRIDRPPVGVVEDRISGDSDLDDA